MQKRKASPEALERKVTLSITLLKCRYAQLKETESALADCYNNVILDLLQLRKEFTEYRQMKRMDYPFK